jgi:hypothetical protein
MSSEVPESTGFRLELPRTDTGPEGVFSDFLRFYHLLVSRIEGGFKHDSGEVVVSVCGHA